MYKKSGQFFYSPTDLTRYMESPFASWMDRFALDQPEIAPEKDDQDAFNDVLAKKGYEHEEAFEADFIKSGLTLVKIFGDSPEEKSNKTLSAMQNGIEVIVQGRLELNQFGGYSDFLVKVIHTKNDSPSLLGDYHYEVWDTKLSSKLKPTFVIQLCCYSEMLYEIQGVMPEFITVALGNGEIQKLRTDDFYYNYLSLKKSFLTEQESFNPDNRPDPADSKSWANWSSLAENILLERDHLFQIANITKGQIKKLNHAGITTMQQLVDSAIVNINGINPIVLNKLKSQATIQKLSVACDKPKFEIIIPKSGEKSGLALLPPHSPFDIFFDIEGYPLDKSGLEYLWGITYFNEVGDRDFKDFWAHNQEQEKQAFEGFVHWAYARWQLDPKMHIYHYANYEIAACRKLMGRYGVCEFEIDQLLRNEVFVDLYKIVKGALLLGEPRYSIKNVEHLYRDKRQTDVASGGDSVAVYDQWRDLNKAGEHGDTWQTSKILNDIREYNIDDCNSTQELVDWLRGQQIDKGIVYIGKTEVIEPEVKEEISNRIQLRDRLLNLAFNELQSNPSQSKLLENLAWSLEFHRRESKPIFWRLFDRLGLNHIELMDDLDCLAGCERTDKVGFKLTLKTRYLAYEYRFDTTQEFKGVNKEFYLLGVETTDGRQAKVKYIKEHSDLDNGLIVIQSKEEPPSIISLIPDEYVNPDPMPKSIHQFVSEYENDMPNIDQSAIIDFLTRSKPRINGHKSGPIAPSGNAELRLQQIISAITHLDNSYLAIQGPPGSGKSYTGKHVIAELVKSGARVGIASNSHKAINNLLLSTAKYCREKEISAFFCCTKDTDPDLETYDVDILTNSELEDFVQPGCVIGTTAWGFARDDMANKLDYLFIDEAGQVAVANLIAMSPSARNLILLGDQMQLGQPSQGAHPAESGLSILDYLLHETPTIPDDMGVFLGTTYRMHSTVNQFISKHIYEGKLVASHDNDNRYIEIPAEYEGPLNLEAGILFIPVQHEGNTQCSDEEVAEIVKLANSLIDRIFHTGNSNCPSRPITLDDILFVTPYNHQVRKLQRALGNSAKVGSIDKFQGQEAPIVFLSMCASDASESPRGLDFLFDIHRINVAISRAQSLAIVVGNPDIAKTPVNRLDQFKKINLFNALAAVGET